VTVETQWIVDTIEDPNAWITLEPDLVFPKYVYLDVVDESDLQFDLRISAFLHPGSRRYEVDTIKVLRRPRWDSTIDGTTLRAIRAKELLRRGLSAAGKIERSDGEPMPDDLSAEQAAQIRAAGPSNSTTLLWVARLYTRAWALHQNPTKEVERQLGLTRPTASVWLRRARDRGYLTDPMDRDQIPESAVDYEMIRRVLEE
jgi:hypothetical protein